MAFDFKKVFTDKLNERVQSYNIAGVVAQDGTVYPLGCDTKVLSTIFELLTRPLIVEIAEQYNLTLNEPEVQNHYPDFTLTFPGEPGTRRRIAVDIKTTYVNKPTDKFGFTLGGYTSFIREGNGTKNIQFPFDEYLEHWVIGYVYERVAQKKAADVKTFTFEGLGEIPLPYTGVRVFVQEKWKIASDKAGSGNTTNIGSITAHLQGFENGENPFTSEEEFLHYWQNYEKTKSQRAERFGTIEEYREWLKTTKPA